MDLKQFATLKKIQGKSDLLRYVIAHDDVPVDEIEKAFGDVITNENSPVVDALETDYGTFLQKQTRLGVVPLANNKFEVSGDIDTNLIETIELLSGDNREEIVNKLVSTIMSEIRGSHDLEVSNIQLTDIEIGSAVDKVLDRTEEALALLKNSDTVKTESLEDESLEDESLDDETLEDETLEDESLEDETLEDESLEDETLEDETLEDETLEDETLEDEALEDEALEDDAFDAEPAGNAQSDIENIDFDNMYPDGVNFDSFDDAVTDIESSINDADSDNVENDVPVPVPVPDADVEDVTTEETPEISTRKIVERIYNQVIDALKERDLDKRLALNI